MPIFRRKKKKEIEIKVIDELETEKKKQTVDVPTPITNKTSTVVPVIPIAPIVPTKPTKPIIFETPKNSKSPIDASGLDKKAIPDFHSIKSHLPPPIPPSVITSTTTKSRNSLKPPELPGMSPTSPTKDVRRQLDDTPIPQEQSIINELKGVLSTGGGLHKASKEDKKKITKTWDQEVHYLRIAKDYEAAGKKQEEAELWQPASMDYVLAVLSLYLSKDVTQAAKYLTILVKTNPLLAVSNPVLKLRGFLEEMLKKHKLNALKTADEMFTLPYQYRDDIEIVKKAIRKAKEEVDKF